jgi:hypothetical protein
LKNNMIPAGCFYFPSARAAAAAAASAKAKAMKVMKVATVIGSKAIAAAATAVAAATTAAAATAAAEVSAHPKTTKVAAAAAPAPPAPPAALVDGARSLRKGEASKRSSTEKPRDLQLQFSELPITLPPLTEAELLAQEEWRAKMKTEKQREKKRPSVYTTGLPKIQQQQKKTTKL